MTLVCALMVPLMGQTTSQPPPQEHVRVWLDANAPTERRLEAMFNFSGNESVVALRQIYEADPKAVSDALVFSLLNGNAGHQCQALFWGFGLQDRTSYSQMIGPALRSPDYEVRGSALSSARFFDDRSELVVSSIVAEIGSTNLSNARDAASQLAVKWNLPEAIEPLLSLVTHTNVTWASMAAGSLSAYAYLPPETLPKLEAALARAEYKATNMVRYTNMALNPPQSHAWAVDGLVVALRKAKEKALLPPSARIEQAKDSTAAKHLRIGTVEGKTSPSRSPAAQTASPVSTPSSGTAGRNSLLVLLGLASVAVIAWILLRGGGR